MNDKMSRPDGIPEEAEIVILDWEDLVKEGTTSASSSSSPFVQEALDRAFGASGVGIIGLRNVPGFVNAKNAFLPQGHKLATLPSEYLEESLTDPSTLYNAGWSHGKEKLGTSPDLAKGCFYYNPVTDLPGTEQDREEFPLSYPKNIWPDEEKLPEFKEQARQIGVIMKNAVVELTKHLDVLAHARQPSYPPSFLYDALKDTDKVKARLLYYFPTQSTRDDSWIGWHNDSGFLTALAGEIYVKHSTGEILSSDSIDPWAGLYVATNDGKVLHVTIPADCMAIQMGECTQIVTAGTVRATPHCVRGTSAGDDIARISLPCFVDTPPLFPLALPKTATDSSDGRQQVLDASVPCSHVPPLDVRWKFDGMTFGDFLHETFSLYYQWSS